jgi:hypothetical protein
MGLTYAGHVRLEATTDIAGVQEPVLSEDDDVQSTVTMVLACHRRFAQGAAAASSPGWVGEQDVERRGRGMDAICKLVRRPDVKQKGGARRV